MSRYLTGFGEGLGCKWKQYSDGTVDYDRIDQRGCTVASWTEKIADTPPIDGLDCYKPITGYYSGDALFLAVLLAAVAWAINGFLNRRRMAHAIEEKMAIHMRSLVDEQQRRYSANLVDAASASWPDWPHYPDLIGRTKAEIAEGAAPACAQANGTDPMGLEAS